MRVVITKITPWFPNSVQIQWDLENATEEGVYTFSVERSGSSAGPWTILEDDITDTYLYSDLLDQEDSNILSFARDIYYRILATPPSGTPNAVYSNSVNLDGQTATTISGPLSVIGYTVSDEDQREIRPYTGQSKKPVGYQPSRLRLLRRKILRDEYIRLKRLSGIEFKLLKRRHFGTRCPKCYDPTTREVTRSRCPICYGTSWTGGYFLPVAILGSTQHAPQIQTTIGSQTKDEINTQRIELLDFPRVDEGDILVATSQSRRFIVLQRYYTTLKEITVHQTATVSELERQAIEYQISV